MYIIYPSILNFDSILDVFTRLYVLILEAFFILVGFLMLLNSWNKFIAFCFAWSLILT